MNDDKPFMVYKHPEEGEMSLTLAKHTVQFCCRWPFDLHTGEWIDIQNSFDRDAYTHGVAALQKNDSVTIKGKDAGYIKFSVLPGNKIKLDVAGCEPERAPTLVYTLEDISASKLMPN